MCMFTALEKLDLNGKNTIPFCANEGSGMGSSERDKKYPQRRRCQNGTFNSWRREQELRKQTG